MEGLGDDRLDNYRNYEGENLRYRRRREQMKEGGVSGAGPLFSYLRTVGPIIYQISM